MNHYKVTCCYQLFRLPWAQIVNQIANITQAGVVVSGDLAKAIEVANISSWNSELRNLFFNDSSKKVEGDLIQQPKLAKLLQVGIVRF